MLPPVEYNYFYSAVAQSLAALIGIVGMFIVYRLQIQENRIRDSQIRLKESLTRKTHQQFDHLTEFELVDKAESEIEILKKKGQISDMKELESRKNDYERKTELMPRLIKIALIAIVYLCFLFLASLIGLTMTEKFRADARLGIRLIYVSIFLITIGLYLIVRCCFLSFGVDWLNIKLYFDRKFIKKNV